MARTQSQNYPEIRRNILRRCARLFARKGYANTSIADLAEANGMSRGLLYHYFASKEAMLCEMLNQHLDFMLAEVEAAARRGEDDAARLRNTVHRMVEINATSQDLQVVLLHDLQNLGPAERADVVRKQRNILAVFGRLIRANDRTGRIDARTATAYTMMFMGMINYTYLWYDPTGPISPSEYAEMAAGTCLRALDRSGPTV